VLLFFVSLSQLLVVKEGKKEQYKIDKENKKEMKKKKNEKTNTQILLTTRPGTKQYNIRER
jgi:hypothetical protein